MNASARKYFVAMGRLGGAATKGISTPAKRRAARENGKLGGRPKKIRDLPIGRSPSAIARPDVEKLAALVKRKAGA